MDLLDSLKSSTHQYHYQIEQVDLLKKITSNKITRTEYKKLLCQFYGFINPCEEKIKQKFQHIIKGREKSALLSKDLLELNCTVSRNFLFCKNIPSFNTVPDVLGYLYVFEGATLGGQLLANLLKQTFQTEPDVPMRYFSGYGEQTRKNWDAFLKFLIGCDFNCDERKNLIESAINTFSSLLNWLTSQESKGKQWTQKRIITI